MTRQEKAQQTRQANRQKRQAKENQRAQELSLMRKRLIKIIESPSASDSEALKAVALLHDIDERERRY